MRLTGYLIIAIGLAGVISCSQMKSVEKSQTWLGVEMSGAESDSVEYDIIVMDPGFESWFLKHRKPQWYHTKEMLETKNWQYVIAWNATVINGQFQMRNPNNPFDQQIDYRKNVDYGMDLNYKLYYYFKFVEDTWGKFN